MPEPRDYAAYRRRCDEVGLAYQKWLIREWNRHVEPCKELTSREDQFSHGDTDIGLEVKFDGEFHKTWNLYIETMASKPGGSFYPDGVDSRADFNRYGIGDYRTFTVFDRRELQALVRIGHFKRVVKKTSRGVLIPFDPVAFQKASSIWRWHDNDPLRGGTSSMRRVA